MCHKDVGNCKYEDVSPNGTSQNLLIYYYSNIEKPVLSSMLLFCQLCFTGKIDFDFVEMINKKRRKKAECIHYFYIKLNK